MKLEFFKISEILSNMKKIIFVVDMLNGFVKEGSLASKNIAKIVPKQVSFLNKNKNIDNLFICDSHRKDDIEMQVYPLHCLKGTDEAQIIDELMPFVKSIMPKNSTNAFHNLKNLNYENYDEYEIIGCCTDICILQLALSLKTYFNEKKQNKKVIVYKNLVSTFDAPNHKASTYHKMAISIMEQSGIIIK